MCYWTSQIKQDGVIENHINFEFYVYVYACLQMHFLFIYSSPFSSSGTCTGKRKIIVTHMTDIKCYIRFKSSYTLQSKEVPKLIREFNLNAYKEIHYAPPPSSWRLSSTWIKFYISIPQNRKNLFFFKKNGGTLWLYDSNRSV